MRGYVGSIVFLAEAVLLVRDHDFFTHQPLWTLPSGGIEEGETPAIAAARELVEESGCTLDPAQFQLIATSEVRRGGVQLSQSWNFTATTTDPHLEPADPDGTVDDAQWFEVDRAVELLALHRYDPIREPAIRFLNGERGLHWTFELTDDTSDQPVFRWHPPRLFRR
ncbi:NUDIX hydrolase [Microlunatus elymi]|uniref:NUDIX hydrolase n=1 Tax=Microlunatus elymi TaxID=2596828 RepID=UPI00143DFA2A|nr:NUDIX hydrolase [Microlunatus elymi]